MENRRQSTTPRPLPTTWYLFATSMYPDDYIFQQDNAAIHTARLTRLRLSPSMCCRGPLAVRISTQLRICGGFCRSEFCDGCQFSSVDELRCAVKWTALADKMFNSLVDSMLPLLGPSSKRRHNPILTLGFHLWTFSTDLRFASLQFYT